MTGTGIHFLAPRFEPGRTIFLAGFQDHFTPATRHAIPALWGRFVPEIGHISGQVGSLAYGVVTNANASGFDYAAAVEVATLDGLPDRFARMVVTAPRFAVFLHQGPLESLPQTLQAIFGRALPEAGLTCTDAPCVERYSADFCAETGAGTVEICVPVRA
jgi:AraC family transcriptional regulator